MSLLTLDDLSLAFGDQPILQQAALSLEPGERVCLIGRNGAGKSTLLRLITGEQQPDAGEIRYQRHLRISQLAQALPVELDQTVQAFVAGGLAHLQSLITEYQQHTQQTAADLREMQDLQQRIDAEGGWDIDRRVATVLSDLDLPAGQRLRELSGGWRRRAALGRALVSNPELLLLDEPTNHLDLTTIEWLENRIRRYPGCVLFITHDRAFLQNLATRIVELDRTRLTSWPGDYANFLRRKEEALDAEAKEKALFNKKLDEEEAWIRQGIKARRTRNEGRVRALLALREEAAERARFKPQQQARISIEGAAESGRKVIELHNIRHGYGSELLIDGLSLKIMRGDRIGLVGNNGVGKSTLLNIMLGRITPQSGTIKPGTNLQIGYFDQMREALDPDKSVADIVGDGRDYIRINGKDRHVVGYLRGFLFSAKRAMTKISALSGGECNRVILARLFTRPSNLLVLDEPTNDLDVETLDVLEDRLVEYNGTLLVVTHDRAFLDNVVTSVLVFEAGGKIQRYMGGYSDWLRHGRQLAEKDDPLRNKRQASEATPTVEKPKLPQKLSYKYQRELEALPERIEKLEQHIAELTARVNDPAFYSQPFTQVQPVLDELTATRQELEQLVERWAELEAVQ